MNILYLLALLAQLVPAGLAAPTDHTPQNTTSSTIAARGAAMANPSHGPWPRDANGMTYIPYCFESSTVRTASRLSRLQAAAQQWNTRVNTIQFYETLANNKPIYCTVRRNGNREWNPALGTVNILYVTAGARPSATVGFDPANTQPFMYRLDMGQRTSESAIVHELGHVLGKTSIHFMSTLTMFNQIT